MRRKKARQASPPPVAAKSKSKKALKPKKLQHVDAKKAKSIWPEAKPKSLKVKNWKTQAVEEEKYTAAEWRKWEQENRINHPAAPYLPSSSSLARTSFAPPVPNLPSTL